MEVKGRVRERRMRGGGCWGCILLSVNKVLSPRSSPMLPPPPSPPPPVPPHPVPKWSQVERRSVFSLCKHAKKRKRERERGEKSKTDSPGHTSNELFLITFFFYKQNNYCVALILLRINEYTLIIN